MAIVEDAAKIYASNGNATLEESGRRKKSSQNIQYLSDLASSAGKGAYKAGRNAYAGAKKHKKAIASVGIPIAGLAGLYLAYAVGQMDASVLAHGAPSWAGGGEGGNLDKAFQSFYEYVGKVLSPEAAPASGIQS